MPPLLLISGYAAVGATFFSWRYLLGAPSGQLSGKGAWHLWPPVYATICGNILLYNDISVVITPSPPLARMPVNSYKMQVACSDLQLYELHDYCAQVTAAVKWDSYTDITYNENCIVNKPRKNVIEIMSLLRKMLYNRDVTSFRSV